MTKIDTSYLTPDFIRRRNLAISKAREGKPLSEKNVQGLKRAWADPIKRARRIFALATGHQKMQARKNHSVASKAIWKNPRTKAKRISAWKKAMAKRGKPTFRGGAGRRPFGFVLKLWRILKPLGYVREYSIGLGRGKVGRYGVRNYQVDFGLVKEKIAIECDGPGHRGFKSWERDRKKDEILHKMGWKVIRIPHD